MPDTCRQCGNSHIIEKDHMVICDDCLSTVALKEDGSVFAEYLTNESFRKTYSESKNLLKTFDDRFQTICRSLISQQGDNPPLLNLMGVYYIHKERYGDAIKVLKQAVDLNPLYVTACYNLAVAYFHFGYNELAVKYYEEARKNVDQSDDRYVEIMGGAALALAETGRLVKAEDYLEKAEMQGFAHGDDVRLAIGTRKIEADEIPGTNRTRGNKTGNQTNSTPPGNQSRGNGSTQPIWPYVVGLVFLGLIVLSGEVNILGCFIIGIIMYFLGSKIAKIKKDSSDNMTDNSNMH